MLRSLHIEHYVLIDSLDVSFPEGLVIITGSTGAGKSILLGALDLLSGAKADAGAIRDGEESCVVEGEFEVQDPDGAIRGALEEAGAEWDEGRLLVRRVVYNTGRSRSFVNDCPVSVGLLSDISSSLFDIHSQHQSLMLSSRRFQLSLLDHYAGSTAVLAEVGRMWTKLKESEREYGEVCHQLESSESAGEYNRAQWEELDKAALVEGELEELEEEQKTLANAESIKSDFAEACASLDSEELGVASALKDASRAISRAARFVPAAEELATRLDSSRIEIEDILSDVRKLDSGVLLSEQRLAEVDGRISLIYKLFQKHGCRSVSELIAAKEKFGQMIFDSSALSERKSELENLISSLGKEYKVRAAELSKMRAEASPRLAGEVSEKVRSLELPKAVFEIRMAPGPEGAFGTDSVDFLFDANGTRPVELSKCASGGEISRIMLCLKAMMARFEGMPTLIFDEIDTGVSGSAAHSMGAMICEMGCDMQVFAVTHLPQVAAKGDAHYVVEKSEDGSGRNVSSLQRVEGDRRVEEIARLLSGAQITQAAIENAKSLLNGN